MKVSRFISGCGRCSRQAGRRGVALIITLILLAVITFMAITFLVVSRSEKGSVSVSTDQLTARLAYLQREETSSRVHLLRQRIPIRNVDPLPYQ